MIQHADALVLFTARYGETVAFYRALGFPLEDERHEEGPVHAACELGPVHFAIYEAKEGGSPERGVGGHTQAGFRVDSVDEAHETLTRIGAPVPVPPQDVPWGRRVVVSDPDGRSVELNEAPPA